MQQQSLQESLSTYHQALHAITQAIHPFNLTTGDWQLWQGLSKSLLSPLEQLRSLAICYGTQKAQTAIDTFQQQMPSFAEGIHAWWRWVSQALNAKTSDPQLQQWVRFEPVTLGLLASTGRQNPKKGTPPRLSRRRIASLYPLTCRSPHSTTGPCCTSTVGVVGKLDRHKISTHVFSRGRPQWLFISSPSYLDVSGVVRLARPLWGTSKRGLDAQTLAVLTGIHNFDIRRADGTTAAQRLFGHSFPNLFEWVVEHMGELPLSRKSSKI